MRRRDGTPSSAREGKIRVPAALAVAFVGSSAMVTMWYGGCNPSTPDPGPDGGRLESRLDAGTDAELPDGDGGVTDAAPDDADDPTH